MAAFPLPITPAGVAKGIKAFDDLAEVIANPPDNRPINQAVGNIGQKLCDFYGSAPVAMANVFGPATPALGLLCKPYFDDAGYDSPIEESEFPGGQCPGTQYEQTVRGFVNPSGVINLGSIVMFGPIRARRILNLGAFSTRWEVDASDSFGTEGTFTRSQGVDPTQATWGTLEAVSGPDDCGNLPGVLAPGPNPPPVPPDFNPGVDFDLDPTGQPFFIVPDIEDPSDPTGPGIPFDPTELPGAPPPVPESNPEGGPEAVGTGEDIGTPGDGAGEDVDFGDPPEGRIWVGAIAEYDAPTSFGNIPNTAPENRVYPRVVGNISLIFGTVRGQAQQVRSQWIDIMRPHPALEVTGCRVNSLPGVDVTLYPISASICPDGAPCDIE